MPSESEGQQQSAAVARWSLSHRRCPRLTRRQYVKEYLFLRNIVMDTGPVIEDWLSVAEAAARLGISAQRVRQLLHAGELDGRKGPGGWVVAENAVRARELAPPAADTKDMRSHEGLPMNLDRWILKGLPWVRGLSASIGSSDESRSIREVTSQFLIGVWLCCTVLVGVVSLIVILLATPPLVVTAILALLVAVPASMLLLRGVVDGFSPNGRLPKHTTSSQALLACYLVAAAGSLAALAMP